MTDSTTYAEVENKTDVSLSEALSNKRKRGSLDQNSKRPAPSQRANSNAVDLSDQATANFLAAHNAGGNDNSLDFSSLGQNGGNVSNSSDTAAAALHYSMTVPQATELSFQSHTSGIDGTQPFSASFQMEDNEAHSFTDFSGLDSLKTGGQSGNTASNESPTSASKPAVGTDEWHKLRRDNHKEVERRRRETINEGINELAKIVPGCEKNKGSILQRAVQFITQLKDNESSNIEKWTLEKLLTEQAITELSASVDKFKAEMSRAWEECDIWKRACNNAGIVPDEYKDQDNNVQNGDS
ncbi:hypothetical protein EJ05DRAFT_488522 [Pseudovirgaria hyperparasitica]|uniref:BHLH domain-containing protein n=1 Tax=Pseudovirgaria hyperparasitica TaxID=470096 RepID=A0A6A6VZ28_9PEZI|nr:uncharacterized protein EJ05DRAFT_488522 [Pseudovirgaria hyperparasitica]KAF2754950.1 hypothetical protein EJ05DRAFT_488522 [Pseudovirgaria hyperparasitica]